MHSAYALFKEAVEELCNPYLESMGADMPPLETPDPSMGDIALPCFTLAKVLRKSPSDIALEFVEYIYGLELPGSVGDVEAVGGYVNFFMNHLWVASKTIPVVLSQKRNYGRYHTYREKMVLEHTSANPTDKLHVGRARNPIIGDTLARLCRFAGYDVETQYYVDDMGRQAVTLAYGEMLWPECPPEEQKKYLGPYQYASQLVKNESKHEESLNRWMHAIETQTPMDVEGVSLQDFVDDACKRVMVDRILPSLERIGVVFDRLVYESMFMRDGSVEKVIGEMKYLSDAHEDENGAFFIEMEAHGVTGRSTRFFFTRGDGTSLYATRDIAYHLWKMENYDRVVDVLGEDHKLEAKQVAVVLSLLGQEILPDVVFYSFVGLPDGKMSTREGRVVYLDDLLEESVERAMEEVTKRRPELSQEERNRIATAVGQGSVRYNIIRVQAEKKLVFRWEDALNFEGDSAPFIQYAYARASSILSRAESAEESGDPELLTHSSETALIKHIAKLTDVVTECADNTRPHLMASYTHGLAVLFNQFYRDCHVLDAKEDLRNARMSLVHASRHLLWICMDLLGIEALEEM